MDKDIKDLLDLTESEKFQERLKLREYRRKNILGNVYDDVEYEYQDKKEEES